MNILEYRGIYKRGLTALIAVVIMSVAMTSALAIFQLLFAESLIARDQEQSVISEYAAESGIECAKYNIYARSGSFDLTGSPDMYCNGIFLTSSRINNEFNNELSFAKYRMTKNDACAVVNISYSDLPVGSPTYRLITMKSHGRYPCDNPRVERGIETSLKRAIPKL